MRLKALLFFCLCALFASAQNVQLHYDFGKPENDEVRNFFVGTIEMFRPDTLGYTFFFIDFEFDSPHNPKGASLGYFEIAREFYIPWLKQSKHFSELGLHVEYNDGLATFPIDDSTTLGDNLGNAWLFGLGYPVKLGNFRLNTMLMYKYIRGSDSPDFQLTIAWYHFLWKSRITVSGFMEFWTQDDFYNNPDDKLIVVYGEPQIWYNLTPKFAVGSEFKVNYNFYPGSERLEVFPTLGLKYEF